MNLSNLQAAGAIARPFSQDETELAYPFSQHPEVAKRSPALIACYYRLKADSDRNSPCHRNQEARNFTDRLPA